MFFPTSRSPTASFTFSDRAKTLQTRSILLAKMAATYPQRKIGDTNVSAQGLGCMGMSFAYTSYGGYDDAESHRVLTKAIDLGINFWDTSDIYGPHTNEKLIGKWFAETGRRKEIFLASKFGNLRGPDGSPQVRGDKEWVHQACNESLQRLGVEQIDLYYQHRVG